MYDFKTIKISKIKKQSSYHRGFVQLLIYLNIFTWVILEESENYKILNEMLIQTGILSWCDKKKQMECNKESKFDYGIVKYYS